VTIREPWPALSLRQPWADLVVSGRKSIELRSWATDYRGPIWIHASKAEDPEMERHFGLRGLVRGGFLGRAVLGAVVPLDRRRWETWSLRHLQPGGFKGGLYGWVLTGPQRLASPVPAPGRPGLFYPDARLQARLQAAAANAGSGGGAASLPT